MAFAGQVNFNEAKSDETGDIVKAFVFVLIYQTAFSMLVQETAAEFSVLNSALVF